MVNRFVRVGEVMFGGKKLGRGFEPLGKGFKSFAFAELCHTSGSFSRS